MIVTFVNFNSKQEIAEIYEHLLAFYSSLDATKTGLTLFLTDLMKNLNL